MKLTTIQRFVSKIKIDEQTQCWEWLGTKDRRGYGFFATPRTVPAHRYAYIYWRGDTPKGLECDHLCRNPGCVNPNHLELVTHKVNCRRAPYANLTHCLNGHEYTPENTYIRTNRNNERACRTCRRIQHRAWKIQAQTRKNFKLTRDIK